MPTLLLSMVPRGRFMPYLIRKIGGPHQAGTEAIEISAPAFSIGRLRECNCVLDHPGVSRLHATVRVEDGKTYLCDKTSRNGTYVNQMRLAGEQELLDGDIIQICDTYLTYREALSATVQPTDVAPGDPDDPSSMPPSTVDYNQKRRSAEQ